MVSFFNITSVNAFIHIVCKKFVVSCETCFSLGSDILIAVTYSRSIFHCDFIKINCFYTAAQINTVNNILFELIHIQQAEQKKKKQNKKPINAYIFNGEDNWQIWIQQQIVENGKVEWKWGKTKLKKQTILNAFVFRKEFVIFLFTSRYSVEGWNFLKIWCCILSDRRYQQHAKTLIKRNYFEAEHKKNTHIHREKQITINEMSRKIHHHFTLNLWIICLGGSGYYLLFFSFFFLFFNIMYAKNIL